MKFVIVVQATFNRINGVVTKCNSDDLEINRESNRPICNTGNGRRAPCIVVELLAVHVSCVYVYPHAVWNDGSLER